MSADFESLVDRLAAASLEAREVLAEVHGAVKDMRQVLAESAAERKRIEETVRAEVEEHVKAGLEEFGEALKKSIAEADQAVHRRFDQLTNVLLHGDRRGRGKSLADLARGL